MLTAAQTGVIVRGVGNPDPTQESQIGAGSIELSLIEYRCNHTQNPDKPIKE